MGSQLVSERLTSKMDREAFASVLSAAALVEDDYRPRLRHVVKKLEFGSPAFELLRQVTERIEPHFVSLTAFNAAFTGGPRRFIVFSAHQSHRLKRIINGVF